MTEAKAGESNAATSGKAGCWSFFGIRRRAEYERDAVTLTPVQVIVAGIIGAIIFVLSLVTLVHFITR
jgi:hypothetical protein